MSSGFRVTLTAWLPCADDLDSLIAARECIGDVKTDAETSGFEEITVTTEFQKFRRRAKEPDVPLSPPSAPDPAEPPQPLDNAPAGTVAGGASTQPPPVVEESGTAAADTSVRAGAGGDQCEHLRQKRYAGGVVACLDCQGVDQLLDNIRAIGGEAA